MVTKTIDRNRVPPSCQRCGGYTVHVADELQLAFQINKGMVLSLWILGISSHWDSCEGSTAEVKVCDSSSPAGSKPLSSPVSLFDLAPFWGLLASIWSHSKARVRVILIAPCLHVAHALAFFPFIAGFLSSLVLNGCIFSCFQRRVLFNFISQ